MAVSAGATGSGAANSSATASPLRASANVPPGVGKTSRSSRSLVGPVVVGAPLPASLIALLIWASSCRAARAKSSASPESSQTVNQASGAIGCAAPASAAGADGLGA